MTQAAKKTTVPPKASALPTLLFVVTSVSSRKHALAKERIVAVGLLTNGDVARLGQNFHRLWPVDETPCFSGLLRAIDEADRVLRRSRNAPSSLSDV